MFTCILLNASLTLGQVPAARPDVISQTPFLVAPVGAPLAPNPLLPGAIQTPAPAPAQAVPPPAKNGDAPAPANGEAKGEEKEKKWEYLQHFKPKPGDEDAGFFHRLYGAYWKQFFPPEKDPNEPETPEPPRRAMPSPFSAPPFPGSEYQGYPLIGVPYSTDTYPLMTAIYGIPGGVGDWWKDSRIKLEGWLTMGANVSTAKNSNSPTSYWFQPNDVEIDQFVFRAQREADTVQTDHIDWGFRAIALWGADYRYMEAGGWGSDVEFQKHNMKSGWDPTEQYANIYIPGFLGGTDIRVGRWIACPDIETQYSVDNYLASHSILFTYDTYTQTGIMLTQKINDQIIVQFAIHSGTDMAPWFKRAQLTPAAGLRWVSKSNNDAFYTWANAINTANFRHFNEWGEPLGRDNFNYIVSTWEHRFNPGFITKTEAYYMWQYNAELGGTSSIGPVQSFGGGGGNGTVLPGLSRAGGVLNYTVWGLSDRDYITLRNEWYDDPRGMRTGFSGQYTSHTIGISHQFNDVMMIRPEVGYYRDWTFDAFDLGTKKGIWIYGLDYTFRF